MPATYGSVTPSVEATATAASAAVPPRRRTLNPAWVAYVLSEAIAPPEPCATACLVIGLAAAAPGANADTSTPATTDNVATNRMTGTPLTPAATP